jgi:hypothetical protein
MNARARRLALVLIAASTFTLAQCRGGADQPPVATFAFASSQTRLPLGSPVLLSYRFDVAPDAAISGDYRVFVHVKTPDGQILWTDDHDLPVPTSQWLPRQTIQYSRQRFVPVDPPYVGDARVEVGLYRPGEDGRLPLAGVEPADRDGTSRAYLAGTFQLQPPSENIFVVFKTGWHPAEFAPEDATRSWQWTQKSGVLAFQNPRSDVMLYLEYAARSDLFPGAPQQVTIASASGPVERLTADASRPALRRIPISAAELGTGDWAELRIEVDRTFVPAQLPGGGRDERELGLQVYHAFVERR